ncbi:MAG TPA: glycosyl hydrolase, partial [Gemmatimonadaceae bacterium]|nr:glycosyl hydrolase [Gemmatimonadaceae bacterium]
MSRSLRAALRLAAVAPLVALIATAAPAQKSKSKARESKNQAASQAAKGAAPDSAFLATLKWRFIGPEGNRADAIAGVPGDPNIYYAGAASGGVWKTTDGGAHWNPIFDDQPVQSIGSIAVAPSDPNVVYVGTGEPYIRSHISVGWGMFKSTDAGKSWSRAGLENTGRISRIAIDPSDPNRLFVAALGTAYGPEPDRGVFRSTDGGKTWTKVLFVNDSTGAVDVLFDPKNPSILYASTWQIAVHTWGRESGGAGSGLWKSTDGGATWNRLTGHGLPTRPMGKVTLGVSPANTQRVYAQIETGDGVPWHGAPTDTGRLWRSDDAGGSWKLV